jgi:hypothetical protein
MSADRAARIIVRACRRGTPVVTLGAPAKIARLTHALFPRLSAALLAGVASLLPSGPAAGADDRPAEPGWQHESWLTRSILTALGRRAAGRNHEVPPATRRAA